MIIVQFSGIRFLLFQIGQLYSSFIVTAISYCFVWQLSRDCYSIVLISLFRFSVIARKSCMTGSIRIFEKSNFTPKLSVLVFLKVKPSNMTDWHILPGLKIDVLIACCRLPVSPRKPSVAQGTVPVVIYRSLQQT